MKDSYEQRVQNQFGRFCTRVLKNEANRILNEYAKQRDLEKSLDDMTQDELTKVASYDRYFQDKYIFEVLGRETVIVSELLAAALAQLPEDKRDVILLKSFLGEEYQDYDLVVVLPNGRPCENRIIEKEFSLLKEKAGLPNVVFHSLRHSSTTYKLKLNHGDLKATQEDTGHAEIYMITKVYAHILDEDRKINAQKFESAFYANPDLRNVKPPQESEQPQEQTLDLAALVEQLQKSPELASPLAALLTAQKAG